MRPLQATQRLSNCPFSQHRPDGHLQTDEGPAAIACTTVGATGVTTFEPIAGHKLICLLPSTAEMWAAMPGKAAKLP